MKRVLQVMLGVLLGWVAALLPVHAEGPALLFPPLTGRVVDAAQLLDTPTTARLSQMLEEYEQLSGEQLVVVTLVDLQGATLEDYGTRLAQAWDVGHKDDGALLIVARDSRRVWIEVGSGLQDRLSDAQCALIINMLIAPQFREGDFAVGIERGAQAMIMALGGHVPDDPEPVTPGSYARQAGAVLWPVLLLLAVVVLSMTVFAMTNLGRRLRLKGSSAATKQAMPGAQKGFGGGGASGKW